MPAAIEVRVECYAGHRAEERPLRFTLGRQNIEVAEILDQWQGPDYRYFKLKGDDGSIYILRHMETDDRWELTYFEQGK